MKKLTILSLAAAVFAVAACGNDVDVATDTASVPSVDTAAGFAVPPMDTMRDTSRLPGDTARDTTISR